MNAADDIRVLIVDDHAVFAQSITMILGSEEGFTIAGSAGNVSEAIEMAARLEPDVILMDLDLPDGDGASATQRIREHRPETRVVMLTASDSEDALLRAVEAGCSGFLTKHQAVREVVSAVRAVHEGEIVMPVAMLAGLLPKIRRESAPVASKLTSREEEVLQLVAQGLSNQAIADSLVVSLHTVRNHVQNINAKLDAHSKLEAVAKAVKAGLLKQSG